MENLTSRRRTVAQWEEYVGNRIRELRLSQNLTQERLAHLADVSVSTIHNLESGTGSSLTTLIKVIRALGRQEWLEQLAPDQPTFSPMQALREQQEAGRTRRKRASTKGAPGR